jgi:hypothetical protein
MRGHDCVHRSKPRVIPWRNDERDAERFTPYEALKIFFGFDLDIRKCRFRDIRHVICALGETTAKLERAVRKGTAHLPRQLLGQFFGALDAPRSHASADLHTFGDTDTLPCPLRCYRFLKRILDVAARCELPLHVDRSVYRADGALKALLHCGVT